MRRTKSLSTLLAFLSHPLVLVGLVLLALFGLYDRLIEAEIFPPVTQEDSASLLGMLLNHGFVIGLTVVVLGFALQFYKLSQHTTIVVQSAEKARTLEQPNRQRMLKRVQHMWIEGVLEQSLYQVARIELGFSEETEAIDHPWMLLAQQPEREPWQIPDGRPMCEVFDHFDRTLLLLGAPGSGKTTLLLELARDLIERAKKDPAHPIPVVFNLSSWGATLPLHKQTLAEWLVAELNHHYDVPITVAEAWVHDSQILPLLDGLDEVAQEHREDCIEAINVFREDHGLLPLVVCSRSSDYEVLSVQLQLLGAVKIQSLSREQIEQYMKRAGTALSGVRAAVREDETLWELLDTPLMLSILALAYQGRMGTDVRILKLKGSMEQRRKALFDKYVEAMFKRRDTAAPYAREKTIHWLSYLASAIQNKVFFPDQPNDLKSLAVDTDLRDTEPRIENSPELDELLAVLREYDDGSEQNRENLREECAERSEVTQSEISTGIADRLEQILSAQICGLGLGMGLGTGMQLDILPTVFVGLSCMLIGMILALIWTRKVNRIIYLQSMYLEYMERARDLIGKAMYVLYVFRDYAESKEKLITITKELFSRTPELSINRLRKNLRQYNANGGESDLNGLAMESDAVERSESQLLRWGFKLGYVTLLVSFVLLCTVFIAWMTKKFLGGAVTVAIAVGAGQIVMAILYGYLMMQLSKLSHEMKAALLFWAFAAPWLALIAGLATSTGSGSVSIAVGIVVFFVASAFHRLILLLVMAPLKLFALFLTSLVGGQDGRGLGFLLDLALGLCLGVFFGLFFGPETSLAEIWKLIEATILLEANPLEDIWWAMHNGLLIGLVVFAAQFVLFLLFNLLGSVVLFGTLFGWVDLQHYVIRYLLWRHDYAPLKYVRFLDYATNLLFLRKVGRGYIFVHRLLMEHFAAKEPAYEGKS